MATVIGVRFKKAGKVYYFDPNGIWPRPGDNVIVETARGEEYGEVVTGARTVNDAQVVSPLKKVVRVASEEDIRRAENNDRREKEAFSICQEKIARHKLDMKLVSVEYTFDNSKIIFYFTANGRVDFRDLVKDLASVFKMRIELRQIGVRDEAKMLGGLGACGRPICCGAFLGDFQPVSIKMAKEQGLSLNPTKISGQCGRLMCCLKYEQDNYEAVLKKVPRVGKDIITPDGPGIITEINAIKERIRVRIKVDDDFDVREYAIDDVRRPGPGEAGAAREIPRDRKPKRPKPVAEPAPAEGTEGEGEGDENRRRRYPHQKAPKNLSTDQFLEKLKENGGATPVAPRDHKRRKGRGRGDEEPMDGEARASQPEAKPERGEGRPGPGERRRRGRGEAGPRDSQPGPMEEAPETDGEPSQAAPEPPAVPPEADPVRPEAPAVQPETPPAPEA